MAVQLFPVAAGTREVAAAAGGLAAAAATTRHVSILQKTKKTESSFSFSPPSPSIASHDGEHAFVFS
jgi:hypothetical protein